MFLLVSSRALGCANSEATPDVDFTTSEWTEISGDAPWASRAGLHTAELGGRFSLMGRRTPVDPETLPDDVWRYALTAP